MPYRRSIQVGPVRFENPGLARVYHFTLAALSAAEFVAEVEEGQQGHHDVGDVGDQLQQGR